MKRRLVVALVALVAPVASAFADVTIKSNIVGKGIGMGGEKGMQAVVSLVGPVWIVKGAPGTQEYMAFYKNAVERGWFFNDPRQAKAQPGQAKAMGEMYRQLAATGGIPYEQEMNIKISGEGPMAAALAKMGNISMTTTVQSVETGTLAADMFAVPADYKLKEQK